MAHIKRKYIDSHWLVFVFQGLLAVGFGWITLFHSGNNINTTIALIGIFLLSLSIIEFFNALHRASKKTGWVISVIIALVDTAAALLLLSTLEQGITWQILTISVYTILRGICEIIIGFRTTVDPTDRFIWVVTGICGVVIGIVALNSGHLDEGTFVRFFGSYLLILGTSSLIYGVHNHSQKREDHFARIETAKLFQKAKKSSKRK